ncbi:unnamed protein product, partial [Didymodactylos carnosus]
SNFSYFEDSGPPIPHQRFADFVYKTDVALLPIDGYQDLPLLSLEDAIKPIEKYLDPSIQDKIYVAKRRCRNPEDDLTTDESASIQLYTTESTTHEESLYYNLNKTLHKADRGLLKPWYSYLKLILTALWKLSSFTGLVYRDVNSNLSKEFKK